MKQDALVANGSTFGHLGKNLTPQQISKKLQATLKNAPEELEASVKAFML